MGVPFGRQDSKIWKEVRDWEKKTAKQLSYTISGSIRYRFPHPDCENDNPCKGCLSFIEQVVGVVREKHEKYLADELTELLNIRCPFSHPGD